jgi:hypothetical protein
MLPSAEALHLRRVGRNLSARLCEQDFEGNRNPQGGSAEAGEQAAAGGMKSPEAMPEPRRMHNGDPRARRKHPPCRERRNFAVFQISAAPAQLARADAGMLLRQFSRRSRIKQGGGRNRHRGALVGVGSSLVDFEQPREAAASRAP